MPCALARTPEWLAVNSYLWAWNNQDDEGQPPLPPPSGKNTRSRRAVPFLHLGLSLPLLLPSRAEIEAMTMGHAWSACAHSRQDRRGALRLPAEFKGDVFLLSARHANSGPRCQSADATGVYPTASSGPEPPPVGRREVTLLAPDEELPAEDKRRLDRVRDFVLRGDLACQEMELRLPMLKIGYI